MQGPKSNPDPDEDCDTGSPERGQFIRDLSMSRNARILSYWKAKAKREMLVYVVQAGLKLDSGLTNPAGVTGVS